MAHRHPHRGTLIKMALLERGMLQREAARMLGMPLSTFNMKLLGKRAFTEVEKASLAAILEKPVGILFPGFESTKSVLNTQDEILVSS